MFHIVYTGRPQVAIMACTQKESLWMGYGMVRNKISMVKYNGNQIGTLLDMSYGNPPRKEQTRKEHVNMSHDNPPKRNKQKQGHFFFNFYQGQTIENGSNTPIVVAQSLAHGLYHEEVVQVAAKAYQKNLHIKFQLCLTIPWQTC